MADTTAQYSRAPHIRSIWCVVFWGLYWPQLYTSCLTIPPATKCNIAHQETLQPKTRTSACALEMFTLRMNMTSKGESPRERQADAHAHAHAYATQKKLSKFVNELMPFLHLVHLHHASGWNPPKAKRTCTSRRLPTTRPATPTS